MDKINKSTNYEKQNRKETFFKYLFLLSTLATLLSLGLITYFIFINGVPGIFEIGFINFMFGSTWDPRQELFGIFPMLFTSLVVTGISSVLGAFIGKWASIFLAFYCPKTIYKIIKPMVELLASIPSVIFGFFGIVVIVPIIKNTFGGTGASMLAGIVILTIMILPTIINLSESSLKMVPKNYYEGAIALGLTHDESIFKVVVPAAKSGIFTSYILGIGRALGETMAIILVAGNSPRMPFSAPTPSGGVFNSIGIIVGDTMQNFLKPVRTLTTGIALEMSYATGLHQRALFGIGVILFILIFLLNLFLGLVFKKN